MMTTDELIEKSLHRPEIVWGWGCKLNRIEAEDQGFELEWDTPIRPGDTYLAKRNTGWKLLTCSFLGEACIHPVEVAYAYDFSECVKVKEM